MKIFFKVGLNIALIFSGVFAFLALSFNRDYRINFGNERIELGKLHGDGVFVVDVARNEVWSGGYNAFLGKTKSKHFFHCKNTVSDAICFAEFFYYDNQELCFSKVKVVPHFLEISESLRHFDRPNAIPEIRSLKKCF